MALQFILILLNILLFGSSLRLVESFTDGRKIVVGNNETDRLALLEFKKQIIDDPYGTLSSWNDSIHFCNWVGITCSNLQQQRVISLDLQGKGLGGNISPSIGNLTFLRYLNMGENSFHGTIPQEMGNLISLQIISFENNTLKGEFPTSLANCTSLREIYFNNNNLVGKISSEPFTSLTKLEVITINGNGLTGEIPAFLGNISSIQEISLEGNELQGTIPESLGQLSNLYLLAIGRNNLSGMVPLSLYNLSSLQIFNLRQNQLHGSLPRDIGLNLPNLQVLILGQNLFLGSIPNSISNISTLEVFDLDQNSFVGPVSNNLGNLQNLQAFTIDDNQCGTGAANDLDFVNSLLNCTNLNSLSIQLNGFKASLPNFKANLSTQLSIFLFGRNQIYGTIPAGIENLVNLTGLGMEDNFLEDLHLPTCTTPRSTKQEKSNSFRIVLAIIGALLGFLLISSFLTLYWIRRSKSKPPSTPLTGERFLKLSYKELFKATEGFSSANFIGSGSFGSVYKGIIDQDETIVAVKVLNLQNPRVYKSFIAECKALRNIGHRNLVKILTSCSSLDPKGKDFKALVYEFMPNGSLDDWLHLPVEAHNYSRNLSLLQRLNIAIDVASALDYLHNNCYVAIIHCDLKPSNILLDSDMIAHVSDFGLARLLLEADDNSSQDQTSTIEIKGSIGYAAPEYGMGGRVPVQGDVFSYGILLLEMFTGKRPIDHMFTDDLNLHNFAKATLPVHVMQILDPKNPTHGRTK
ncbi:putative receptor-like protein kinase At3g47110 [Telopea speciosissima]|uniref:putative receptor-like protein kinase At3g47110 n=1 Tax=Telopea speciosissima TaxID=54955 RepID=UPI001CC82531|nr:putative receptor-like protein kinase At3g47110 [Telopea speciosissima]